MGSVVHQVKAAMSVPSNVLCVLQELVGMMEGSKGLVLMAPIIVSQVPNLPFESFGYILI
jgi:hypothetical protein